MGKTFICIRDAGKHINKGDKVIIVKDMLSDNTCIMSKIYKENKYVGVIFNDDILDFFEPYIEEQEECTITKDKFDESMDKLRDLAMATKEPTKEIFKGWDIIRLISEGKLKDGTMLIETNYSYKYIYNDGEILDCDGDPITINDLTKLEFEIDEPIKLVSYKEAVENNYMIRHKDWDNSLKHTTVHNVLSFYTKEKNEGILVDLLGDEKYWEVE